MDSEKALRLQDIILYSVVGAFISAVLCCIGWMFTPNPTFQEYIKDEMVIHNEVKEINAVHVFLDPTLKLLNYSLSSDVNLYYQIPYDVTRNFKHCPADSAISTFNSGTAAYAFFENEPSTSPLRINGSSDADKLMYIENTVCSDKTYRKVLTSDVNKTLLPKQLKFASGY